MSRTAGQRCLVAVENWIWGRRRKSCAGGDGTCQWVRWTEGEDCKSDSALSLYGSGKRQVLAARGRPGLKRVSGELEKLEASSLSDWRLPGAKPETAMLEK